MTMRATDLSCTRALLAVLVVFLEAATASAGSTAADERRVALVIGYNAYPESPSANAVNDAKPLASALP